MNSNTTSRRRARFERSRMARSGATLAILALIAALGATWLVLRPEQAWVWTARSDLEIGETITDSKLARRRLLLLDGRFRIEEDLIDRTLQRCVKAGEPITERDLDTLKPVLVAATVIEKGTPLDGALFRIVMLPAKRVIETSITDLAQLDGWAAGARLEPGEQLVDTQREALITVPVPTGTVNRGETVPKLGEKDLLASEIVADTILVAAEAEGKLALVNLLPGQPIEMEMIDHKVEIYVPTGLIPAGTRLDAATHLTTLEVGAATLLPDTLLELEGIDGKVAAQNLLPRAPIQKEMLSELPVLTAEIQVPRRLIPAGATIEVDDLVAHSFAADSVLADTIVGPDGLVGRLAAQNLLPYAQILGGMVIAPGLTVEIHVPKTLIPAGAAIEADDLKARTVPVTSIQTDTIVGPEGLVGMLAAHNLLPNALVGKDMVVAPPRAPVKHQANLIEIVVHATGARGGELPPGTVVDVYAAARLVIDADGDPNPLTVPVLEASFPVRNATIRSIQPDDGRYRVTLEIEQDADVAAIVMAAPLVEFYLVEHGGPAG